MQTNYNDPASAIEGFLADLGFSDIVSRAMGANVAQVSTLTVDAATNSTLYEMVVNGVPIQYTSDASATIGEIHAGLLAAAQASLFLSGDITFGGVSPNLTVTAVTAGVPFTLTEAHADLSIAATTPNVSSNPIPFGRGLASSGPGTSSLPSLTGFLFDGISVMKHKTRANASGLAQFEDGETVPNLRKGRIWVKSESIITAVSNPVYLRHTANGSVNVPGQFRIDADTANADLIASTQAQWVTTTTAINQLAVLSINLP